MCCKRAFHANIRSFVHSPGELWGHVPNTIPRFQTATPGQLTPFSKRRGKLIVIENIKFSNFPEGAAKISSDLRFLQILPGTKRDLFQHLCICVDKDPLHPPHNRKKGQDTDLTTVV